MAPPVRAKILAAANYLTVAPTVVKVVRDLELPEFDARIRVSTRKQSVELDRLSADWGLGSSMKRARDALGAAGQRRNDVTTHGGVRRGNALTSTRHRR